MTYSPTGRLFQVEYALEAIKQGSAAVGLRSNTHVVLVALKRNAEELGSYQKKILCIDDHIGLALAGLAPDSRVLANHLRSLCIQHELLYDQRLSVSRAVTSIADKAQANTQQYGRRPYGVGLLISGYDESGPHLYEFLPSGSMLEYLGSAIGARSQAARTYLERHLEEFAECTLEQLVIHGLLALRDTLPQDKELTFKNTSVAVVGKDLNFKIIDDEDVAPWLDKLDSTSRKRSQPEVAPNEETAAPETEMPEEPSQENTGVSGEMANSEPVPNSHSDSVDEQSTGQRRSDDDAMDES